MRQTDALSAILANWRSVQCSVSQCCMQSKSSVRLFDHRTADHSSILQHILKIDQAAVVHMLCKIIGIMEMNDPLLMRIVLHLAWQQGNGA